MIFYLRKNHLRRTGNKNKGINNGCLMKTKKDKLSKFSPYYRVSQKNERKVNSINSIARLSCKANDTLMERSTHQDFIAISNNQCPYHRDSLGHLNAILRYPRLSSKLTTGYACTPSGSALKIVNRVHWSSVYLFF